MPVSIELFISLLFVVVIEIGGVARSLDLERISKEKLPPFFIGVFFFIDSKENANDDKTTIPQLGRFNFLHGANLAILFLGFVLVVEQTSGFTGILISLITFAVWALLPLFEVDEYEEILVDGYRPVSYYHHVIVVALSSLLIYFYDFIFSLFFFIKLTTFNKYASLAIISVFLYYVMLFGFLTHLERELDRADSDRIPDSISRT